MRLYLGLYSDAHSDAHTCLRASTDYTYDTQELRSQQLRSTHESERKEWLRVVGLGYSLCPGLDHNHCITAQCEYVASRAMVEAS